MDSFSSNSPDELLEFLKKSRIANPHTNSVTKNEVEKWCMYRLLSTLCSANELDFPIEIRHEDKPDFRCLLSEHGIGIEITRATTEPYERARVLRDKHYPDVWLDLSHFKWGAASKSSEEILKILEISQTRLTGPAIYGKKMENEWAIGLSSCVYDKTTKLNHQDFVKFDQNWLLIFDSLTAPGLDYDFSITKLRENINSYWSKDTPNEIRFNSFIVESNNELLFFSDGDFYKQEIVDLWR